MSSFGYAACATKRAALNRGADALHEVIAGGAAAGVHHVDARARFAGRNACDRSPWINRFPLFRPAASFHPGATATARTTWRCSTA